mmetsp:Transcript_12208/g.18339  ORF Transcript_12208/g.18339 Transcript_12208/m.18339 type:complete len:516 (+) Transcript_12208:50-1597(+)
MVAISTNRRRNAAAGIISQRRLICFFSAVIAAMMAFYTFFVGSMLNKHQLSQLVLQSPANMNTAVDAAKVAEKEEEADGPPVVIAHAISLIKCGKKSSVTGFIDAAAVLRHSIHKNSIHYKDNNNIKQSKKQSSRYSYQMYAIVHTSCEEHAKSLERLGYQILVKDHPVKKEDIKGEWLRNHIEGENCCGSAEFIKLYAYHLTDHPIVVHWDMDVAILQPLDDLYDAMLYPATHPRGKAARGKIERQHPEDEWPETVNAFLTRDITSAKPWEKITAVQGGFLVARPDKRVFDEYIEFIKEGNYEKGRGDGSGWSGLGYGGFQGAMAYQGAVAFYYDQLAPNTAVELNVCRWNQVAADVIWRGPERKDEHHLQCRDYPRAKLENGEPDYASNTKCEDCRMTPVEVVKTVHYTACKKPWECQIPTPRVPRDKRQAYRLHNLVSIDNCSRLVKEWFKLRKEFEDALETASNGQVKPSTRDGVYYKDYFLGYCRGERGGNYVAIEPPPDDFDIKKIYGM